MRKTESAWSLTNAVGAGVMLIALAASAAGILQLTKRSARAPQPAQADEESKPAPEGLEQVRQERDEALRQLREQRARARVVDERSTPQHKDAKCVGGVLFARVNGELRNVGYCK